MQKEIPKILKKIREAKALSPTFIANNVVWVTPSFVLDIERGKKPPSLLYLSNFCFYFKIKLSTLISLVELIEDYEKENSPENFPEDKFEFLIQKLLKGVSLYEG